MRPTEVILALKRMGRPILGYSGTDSRANSAKIDTGRNQRAARAGQNVRQGLPAGRKRKRGNPNWGRQNEDNYGALGDDYGLGGLGDGLERDERGRILDFDEPMGNYEDQPMGDLPGYGGDDAGGAGEGDPFGEYGNFGGY